MCVICDCQNDSCKYVNIFNLFCVTNLPNVAGIEGIHAIEMYIFTN